MLQEREVVVRDLVLLPNRRNLVTNPARTKVWNKKERRR